LTHMLPKALLLTSLVGSGLATVGQFGQCGGIGYAVILFTYSVLANPFV
jgi:hypothetical protein